MMLLRARDNNIQSFAYTWLHKGNQNEFPMISYPYILKILMSYPYTSYFYIFVHISLYIIYLYIFISYILYYMSSLYIYIYISYPYILYLNEYPYYNIIIKL